MDDDPLGELHRRYDGLIPEAERRRAAGIDPELSDARGAVRFWQEQIEKARDAIRANTRSERRAALAETWDHARAGLARAEARLQALEHPEMAGPAAFFKTIARGLR
ncbi:MAG: hypothetical protein EXQ86_09025 [Rhodospirillales bacterium]|nr:hypothetical protein [Rhodospirillales bacterium]